MKQTHFPHNPDEPLILHREDIINQRGPFWRLRDPDVERRFNEDFLAFLRQQAFWLITVVIDKKSHIERYGAAAFHPYHYCLVAMLERYAGFLNRFGAQGDVMAEARGTVEDRQLEAAYQGLLSSGTQFRNAEFFASVLTSCQLKLRRKEADIAGLQVADLLAHPCKQSILVEHQQIQDPGMTFGAKIVECVAQKYNRRLGDDRVEGYGTIFLA